MTLQVFLRVLYTVNNNPQYILAKSSSQVSANVCYEITAQFRTNELAYARAPLKACLMAICDSSPELLHDPVRDFSVYVLDPLEAQPTPTNSAHATHDSGSPRGIAVALGLMSWALESNDSMNVLVTGTVVPNTSPALEVIFALRETRRMPKPALHSYISLGPMTVHGPSQPLLSQQPVQAPGMSWLSTSYTQHHHQEQRTLTRSVDFPELYIGPPRRAPGRPEGSISSRSKMKSQPCSSSVTGTSLSRTPGPRQGAGARFKQKTRPKPLRPPPPYPPFICQPLTRNTETGHPGDGATGIPTFHQQPHTYSQYPHLASHQLLEILSAIPSSGNSTDTTPEQQATLVSALQGFLAVNPHLLQLAATNMGFLTGTGERTIAKKPVQAGNDADAEEDDADLDVIILDASTVDTAAFCKPSRKGLAINSDTDTLPLAVNQESPMPSTVSSPLPASTPPSGRESTLMSSQTSTPEAIPEMKTPTSIHVTSERLGGRESTPVRASEAPETPIFYKAHKRKLAEYIQGQTHPLMPMSPPSPSPSVARTSSLVRVPPVRQRILSSPTRGKRFLTSPSRLPSILGSMRTASTNKCRIWSTKLISDPSKSSDPKTATSAHMEPDTNPLKGRLNVNLNEIMKEHEARRNAKFRKRAPSGNKSSLEENGPRVGPPHPAKHVSASRSIQSSPPRPLFRSAPMISPLVASTRQSALVRDTTIANPILPPGNPLKKFVMPAWARTNTAMLPRLSEDVLARQRAEQEAKKTQASLRRREAAKAKRKRLREADRPSKESSDEGELVADDLKSRVMHPASSVTRVVPLPSPPSLPVFALDAVAPVPSSLPQTHRQPGPPVVPSTPPRKPAPLASAQHRTPNKSSPCSLFTPSGQNLGSLFTPGTPSVSQPLTQVTFTPHSPTAFHRSDGRKSPQKNVLHTTSTPKRNSANHYMPRNLRSGKNAPFPSPSSAVRTPKTQMCMGTRAFLLPPPSPSTSRTPHQQNPVGSGILGGGPPLAPDGPGAVKQEPSSDKRDAEKNKDSIEGEVNCQPDDGLTEDISVPTSHHHPTIDGMEGISELPDVAFNGGAYQEGVEYASSPLPPSSPPLPASPFSSPIKRHESNVNAPAANLVPDSDILFPSASDSDGPQGVVDTNQLSNDACASWFTDSEASAWLTEAEGWLTDAEGPPITDSDCAWLSDSDAVFADMSSLPPSSASNWFSDDADVDTDGEGIAMDGRAVEFDTNAFEKAFAALMERGGLLEGNALGDGDVTEVSDTANENKVTRDLKTFLDGLGRS